jgi:hypothetical protein
MNLYLQTTQFQYRKDAVTHALTGAKPFELVVLESTEASIRSHMAVPAENWGNADAVVDAQACVEVEYADYLAQNPGMSLTVLAALEE